MLVAGCDFEALVSDPKCLLQDDDCEVSVSKCSLQDDDCEEGEIKEPGGSKKPFVKPTCRFFLRGACTWGLNCRFLHPGINDKGWFLGCLGKNARPRWCRVVGIFESLGKMISNFQIQCCKLVKDV